MSTYGWSKIFIMFKTVKSSKVVSVQQETRLKQFLSITRFYQFIQIFPQKHSQLKTIQSSKVVSVQQETHLKQFLSITRFYQFIQIFPQKHSQDISGPHCPCLMYTHYKDRKSVV